MHDVKSGDGLAASVLSVGHSIADDVLKEYLEYTTGLLVDQARDTLDTSPASQTADGGGMIADYRTNKNAPFRFPFI